MYDDELTVGQWLLTLIISGIPCVGFIFLLVWAFGSDTQIDKKRYAQAQLVMILIVTVLSIILYLIMGAALIAFISSIGAALRMFI